MSKWLGISAALSVLLILPIPALAQDAPDTTMDVVEDTDHDEQAVMEEIALPADAAPQAQENAAFGIDAANEARERRREFGMEVAGLAREAGKNARVAGGDIGDHVGDRIGSIPVP